MTIVALPSRPPSSLAVPRATGLGRARAIRALAEVGASAEGLERASSVTNEVWMTAHYVVRLNRDASHRLAREAALSEPDPARVREELLSPFFTP